MADDQDDGRIIEHRYHDPKSRGGRTRRALDAAKPKKPVNAKGLANLRPWKSGQSGNPAGVSKTLVELTRQARDLVPGAIQKLNEILHDPKAMDRDKIAAANSILDRGLGRPIQPIFQQGSDAAATLEGGESANALLFAARSNPDAATAAELRAEAERLEAKLDRERKAYEAHLADAQAKLDAGEGDDVSGLTRMLLAAKRANANLPPVTPKARHPAPAPDDDEEGEKSPTSNRIDERCANQP